MKIRLISALFTISAVTGLALAQRAGNTRVIATVRDSSGQLVSGASVKFFGPFRGQARNSNFTNSTGRNGEAEQSLPSGRYLVFASDDSRGSAISTYDVSDRSGTSLLDVRLKSTRRPTIQFVLMSEDRNEPISNANIEVFTNETGKRDNFKSRGNGITSYEIPGSLSGGRYEVAISSNDFDTVTKTLNFRPRTDTSSMIYYVQMRRRTGLQPRTGPQSHGRYSLDGMIRTTNKDREEVGGLVTIDVGLLYSGGTVPVTKGHSVVTITRPDGSTIVNESSQHDLGLNQYSRKEYDVRPNMAGVYTVIVKADGEDNTRWTGKYTFNVHPRGRNNSDQAGSNLGVVRGDYIGRADIETDNGVVNSHSLSITLKGGNRNTFDVKGWLAPNRENGFSISFEGTYDVSKDRLDAKGTMPGRNDKKWDIRITGSPDRNGRLDVRVNVRALDNSFNRTYSYLLTKQ